MKPDYQDIINILQNQHDMLLVGHEYPDGDCLGSVLALYEIFGGAEKNWQMLVHDEIPKNLRFLPGLEKMVAPDSVDDSQYSAVLLVDCGEAKRCGPWLEPMLSGKKVYCIDHHISNVFHGDLAVVEPNAGATAESVAAIALQAGSVISDSAALNLYAAMAADTGCFRFNNTTSRSMEIAAVLLPQIDLETIRIHLFEDRSLTNIAMLAECLNNIVVECDGLLSYSYLPHEKMLQVNAKPTDCHNIINFTLAVSGVKVGLLFEEHEDYVKMSFRCRNGYRVDELAEFFGGGGHKVASGCKMDGNLKQVMPLVLAKARELIVNR